MKKVKVLDLTGKTKLNPNDGKKRGFLLKTSEGNKLATRGKYRKKRPCVIALMPPKGPKGQNWKRPFRFKVVELYKGIGNGAPLLCKLVAPSAGRTLFYEEDGNSRGIYCTPFAAADLPKTPCTLVADEFYLELKNPRVRID